MPRAAASSASVPRVGLAWSDEKSRRTVAGSELIAWASPALVRPAASRAVSSSLTIRSMVAIRIDSARTVAGTRDPRGR
jgi:hypothetical protein